MLENEKKELEQEAVTETIVEETIENVEQPVESEVKDAEIEQIKEEKHCDCGCHEKARKNDDMNSFVNKKEGLLMLVISLLVIIMSLYTLHNTIETNTAELKSQIQSMNNKISMLEAQVADLEDDIEFYQTEIANRPIEITLSANGEVVDNVENFDEVVEEVEEFDTRAFLGVAFLETNDVENADAGLKVDLVYQYSPAYFAEMKDGDILLSVNGVQTNTFADLDAVISSLTANDIVDLVFITTGESGIEYKTASVQLTYRGNFDLD